MSVNVKQLVVPAGTIKKVNIVARPHHKDLERQVKTLLTPEPVVTSSIGNELSKLRAAAATIQQIRLSAQRELELAKKMRADAQRYQQETETKARSQAQQLILRARLATQKEIEEVIRQASAEIQKVLADIRVIRITAQEELAAQRKFTDAARLCSLAFNVQDEIVGLEVKKEKKKVAGKK
jgi:SepF-like predicted cell division protein (DUF552 family)